VIYLTGIRPKEPTPQLLPPQTVLNPPGFSSSSSSMDNDNNNVSSSSSLINTLSSYDLPFGGIAASMERVSRPGLPELIYENFSLLPVSKDIEDLMEEGRLAVYNAFLYPKEGLKLDMNFFRMFSRLVSLPLLPLPSFVNLSEVYVSLRILSSFLNLLLRCGFLSILLLVTHFLTCLA
jgi:hypothetical protein